MEIKRKSYFKITTLLVLLDYPPLNYSQMLNEKKFVSVNVHWKFASSAKFLGFGICLFISERVFVPSW